MLHTDFKNRHVFAWSLRVHNMVTTAHVDTFLAGWSPRANTLNSIINKPPRFDAEIKTRSG